ncbi:MAG: hypothetical protein ACO1QS_04220 [Verrucomicrobiota bacterium]
MKKVLHVLTREDDELAEAIVAADREAGEGVEVVQLTATKVDYQQLLEGIFAADSVQSW